MLQIVSGDRPDRGTDSGDYCRGGGGGLQLHIDGRDSSVIVLGIYYFLPMMGIVV